MTAVHAAAADIALAGPGEAALCLALLPEAARPRVELLAAWQGRGDERQLVGAAAIDWQSWTDRPGFPLLVHVVPAARRRGIGQALVAAAAVLAQGETDGLWAWAGHPEASEAAAFARACGAGPGQRLLRFRMAGAGFTAQLARLVAALGARGHVPPGMRVVPLREAPLDEVAVLVAREFRNPPMVTLARLQRGLASGGIGDVDYDKSVATLDDTPAGQVLAGALLYRWAGGHPVVEANVVAPAYRHGPVNVLQLHAAFVNGIAAGAEACDFHCDEQVTDTVRIARRGGAVQTGVETRYYLPLG